MWQTNGIQCVRNDALPWVWFWSFNSLFETQIIAGDNKWIIMNPVIRPRAECDEYMYFDSNPPRVKIISLFIYLQFPESCKGHDKLELPSPLRLSSVGSFASESPAQLVLPLFINFTMSSRTSDLLTSTRISSRSLQVVTVHSLNSSMVGLDFCSSRGIILENWSREATIRQSLPDSFWELRDLENSFCCSQVKSFTRCGRCWSYVTN